MIIQILAHRNASQRKSIRETYAATFGEDLLSALDKELSSDFEVSFTPPFSFFSNEKAMYHSRILTLPEKA